MLQVGLGAIGLSSRDFWDLTYYEFEAAYDGWKKANGMDSGEWTSEEIDEVREAIKATKEKYPDGKPKDPALIKALKTLRKNRKEADNGNP